MPPNDQSRNPFGPPGDIIPYPTVPPPALGSGAGGESGDETTDDIRRSQTFRGRGLWSTSHVPKTNFDLREDDPFFNELKTVAKAIELFLSKNPDLRRHPQAIGVYYQRRGLTYEDAQPTILVHCAKPRVVAKILKKFHEVDRTKISINVEKNELYLVGIGSDDHRHHDLDPELRRASSCETLTNFTIQRSKFFLGTRVMAYDTHSEIYGRATMGGYVWLDDVRYGLTVRHICTPSSTDTSSYSNDKDDIEDTSDSEPDDSGVDTSSCDDQFSDLSASNSDEEDTEPFLQDRIPMPNTRVSAIVPSIGEYHLGHVHTLSETRWGSEDEDSEYFMDWALVQLDDNVEIYNTYGSESPYYQISVRPETGSPRESQGRDVLILTSSSGCVRGRMAANCSLLLPGQRRFWSYWRVDLETKLVKGDSGSWVLDEQQQGRVLGIVLAASRNPPCAYIVPIDAVLDDIRMNCRAKRLQIASEAPVGPIEDRSALLEPLVNIPQETQSVLGESALVEEHQEIHQQPSRDICERQVTLGTNPTQHLLTYSNSTAMYRHESAYLDWQMQILARKQEELGKEHLSTLETMNDIAVSFSEQGKYDQALQWYRQSLVGRERALGKEHPSTLGTINNMANVFSSQGKYDEALEWYWRAFSGKKKVLGEEHKSSLDTANNLAVVFSIQGRYEEALRWYEWVLARKEKILGKEHPSTLQTVDNMAIVFDLDGKHQEAIDWYERALRGREKILGKEHPSTLSSVNNLAVVLYRQRKYNQAEEWCRRALDGYDVALGKELSKEHPLALDAINNMANVFREQCKYAQALEWYNRALVGYEKVLGKEHPATLGTVHNIANVFRSEGRYEDARAWYRRAWEGKVKALGEGHPSTLISARAIRSLSAGS